MYEFVIMRLPKFLLFRASIMVCRQPSQSPHDGAYCMLISHDYLISRQSQVTEDQAHA